MRELFLVTGDSTDSSLIVATADEDSSEEFFIAVTDELRDLISGGRTPAPEPVQEPVEKQESTEVDPRLSAPLKMSPREIQESIRAGATIAEIAEKNEVPDSRIEPFAHPVLLERARIAELAKQSHPVREDGPTKLSLWEVLATAFAARGHDLSNATWDAYRDPTNKWIVQVTWTAGLSDNQAEWTLNLHGTSQPTAEPKNAVAADLINPDFIQPVRSLSSLTTRHNQDSIEEEELESEEDTVTAAEEDFLQHPPQEAPKNRRRKAVTPHWEDVLLGVRANTKRPKK